MFILPGGPLEFPDPRMYDAHGLVAVGGDLSPERLLLAYDSGIFPWYDDDAPPLWWSPDPRAVIAGVHVSRSLARRMRRGGYEVTHNRAFRQVMEMCADRPEQGTWILPEMIDAYSELHRLGHAHSVEVWASGELVGGIYGVQRGALFAAESMFHRQTDASKIALVSMVKSYFRAGVDLFEVQFLTPHLEAMGAAEISRHEYLGALAGVRRRPVQLPASGLVEIPSP